MKSLTDAEKNSIRKQSLVADAHMRAQAVQQGRFVPKSAVIQISKDPELKRAMKAQSTLPGCDRNFFD